MIAKEREAICNACSLKKLNSLNNAICDSESTDADAKTGEQTHGCGCFLHLKQRSLHSSCPLHKWLALTDDQEIGSILKNLK